MRQKVNFWGGRCTRGTLIAFVCSVLAGCVLEAIAAIVTR